MYLAAAVSDFYVPWASMVGGAVRHSARFTCASPLSPLRALASKMGGLVRRSARSLVQWTISLTSACPGRPWWVMQRSIHSHGMEQQHTTLQPPLVARARPKGAPVLQWSELLSGVHVPWASVSVLRRLKSASVSGDSPQHSWRPALQSPQHREP